MNRVRLTLTGATVNIFDKFLGAWYATRQYTVSFFSRLFVRNIVLVFPGKKE